MPHGLTVRGRKIAKSTAERRMKSSSRTATELLTSRLSAQHRPPGRAGDMREKLSQILGPVGPARMAEKGAVTQEAP